jgi:hypothetical protein
MQQVVPELEPFGTVIKTFFASETVRETALLDSLNSTKNAERARVEKDASDEQVIIPPHPFPFDNIVHYYYRTHRGAWNNLLPHRP